MWLAVADSPAGQDAQTAIVLGVIGLLTAVLVAVATGVFSVLTARANRTTPAPVSPMGDHTLFERVAVLERRADDSDERDEVQDRRLDQLERAADLDNPDWRHRVT